MARLSSFRFYVALCVSKMGYIFNSFLPHIKENTQTSIHFRLHFQQTGQSPIDTTSEMGLSACNTCDH